MKVLNELGFDWRDNGAVISFVVDGHRVDWFLPLRNIRMVFGEELAAVGCPLIPSVGDPPTVAGLFGAIGRGISRAARGVSRGIKKAARGVSRTVKRGAKAVYGGAKGLYKKVVPKALQKAARRLQKSAMKAYRWGSGLAHKGLSAATHIPVLGNFARLGKSALSVQDRLYAGKMPSTKQLGRLAKETGFAAADFFAPGSGTAARAGLRAGLALAEGKRWDEALQSGAVEAASRYVPRSVARGAFKAGSRIARGHRVDKALASGVLTAGRGYMPKGVGRKAFDFARDVGGGKRVDRALKKQLRKVTKVRGLSRVVPDAGAMAAARNAVAAVQRAQRAAKRARRGYRSAQDVQSLIAGRNTSRGLSVVRKRAKKGDQRSRAVLAAMRMMGRYS